MAVSEYDKKHLTPAQQAEIQRVTDDAAAGKISWTDAHNIAEGVRGQAGYSGGADGSSYSPTSSGGGSKTSSGGGSSANNQYAGVGAPSGFAGSATGVNTYTQDQASILAEMNANSQKWFGADPETQAALHERNQQLASMLGGSVSFDHNTGYWSGSAEQAPMFEYEKNTQIDDLLNKVLNREPFSYDHTTDPSYLAYAEQYKRLGDRAREDTLGDIAGLTGGYASSWAASAASQAQNDYNSQLSGVIPELYDAAYNRYLNEDSLLRSDLGLLMDVDNTNYNRYRDTVADRIDERNFNYQVERDNVADSQWQQSFDWGQYVDKWNMDNTAATQKFEQLMTKWQMMGTADAEVAAELGVPEGATTESYYFNKANLELNQRKASLDERQFGYQQTQDANEQAAVDAEKALYTNGILNDVIAATNSTGSHFGGAEELLSLIGKYNENGAGLGATDYYSIGAQAGIPNYVLEEVFHEQMGSDDGGAEGALSGYDFWFVKVLSATSYDEANAMLSENATQIIKDAGAAGYEKLKTYIDENL